METPRLSQARVKALDVYAPWRIRGPAAATVTPGQELAEIIATWTKLPPEIRTAVLILIRMSKLDAT